MQIKVNHTLWVYSSGNGEKLLSFCSLQQKSFWKERWFQPLLWKCAACDFIPLAVMVTIQSCKWWRDVMGERVVSSVISINLPVNTWPRTHMFCNYVSLKKPAISPQYYRIVLFLFFFFFLARVVKTLPFLCIIIIFNAGIVHIQVFKTGGM